MNATPIHRADYLSAEEEAAYLHANEDGTLQAHLSTERGVMILWVPEGMINPRSRSLHRHGIFWFPARGTSYHEAAVERADTRPGARAVLIREPDNPHDANAIGICDESGKHCVGYINRQQAARVAPILDSGAELVAVFTSGDRPGARNSPVRVLAASPPAMAALLAG